MGRSFHSMAPGGSTLYFDCVWHLKLATGATGYYKSIHWALSLSNHRRNCSAIFDTEAITAGDLGRCCAFTYAPSEQACPYDDKIFKGSAWWLCLQKTRGAGTQNYKTMSTVWVAILPARVARVPKCKPYWIFPLLFEFLRPYILQTGPPCRTLKNLPDHGTSACGMWVHSNNTHAKIKTNFHSNIYEHWEYDVCDRLIGLLLKRLLLNQLKKTENGCYGTRTQDTLIWPELSQTS